MAAILLLLAACDRDATRPGLTDRIDMRDTSYARGRDVERVNARGSPVRWRDYAGQFLWVEYAAPWCGICAQQTSELRDLRPPNTAMVTVMTSEMGGYGHPATRATAAAWAGRYGLDPDRVIAADLTSLSVPRHLLFSPEGHTLFARDGYMTRQEVDAVINARQADWRVWMDPQARAESTR
jgi:hypothetical protein